jgi:serine protease Do
MTRFTGFAATILLLPALGFAENGFWVEGKERPEERVNVGTTAVTPDAYVRISEKMDAAVVNISTTQVVKPGRTFGRIPRPRQRPEGRDQQGMPFLGDPFDDDFFNRFFNAPQQEFRRQSLGSGFILNSEGYIVTNNHVVEKADEIKVVLHDETQLIARVIGRDPKTDVALLKIDAKKPLTHVILGDSSRLKVGDIVVAIGNPFGLSHSLTQGIVSAKERSIGFGSYDAFIQTDASINPGNSGGPLLNLQGEVVGINAAIVASGQGIGFAIPINLAKSVLMKLHEGGKVVRGWLGVMIQKVDEETAAALKLSEPKGALVSEVQKGSPAQEAGIQTGDVIVKFDGKAISDFNDLPIRVADTPVGATVPVEILRDGKSKVLKVRIQELKGETTVASGEETQPEKQDVLGLTVSNFTGGDVKGVLVAGIGEASAAAAHGIGPGDVILEVDRHPTPDVQSYRKVVAGKKKGDNVLLLVKRGENTTLFVAFTI